MEPRVSLRHRALGPVCSPLPGSLPVPALLREEGMASARLGARVQGREGRGAAPGAAGPRRPESQAAEGTVRSVSSWTAHKQGAGRGGQDAGGDPAAQMAPERGRAPCGMASAVGM